MAAPSFKAEEMAGDLLDIFANLHQPAFLYGDYFDIIAVSHAALLLHNNLKTFSGKITASRQEDFELSALIHLVRRRFLFLLHKSIAYPF
ncbi:MAG: hypothetical protein NZ553_05325 [Caldilinea sp.]|nr:hypothetical protein [Caldilinea sp.]MDW8439879.1 hypothetical protein [Caldilineaceae bacterium]